MITKKYNTQLLDHPALKASQLELFKLELGLGLGKELVPLAPEWGGRVSPSPGPLIRAENN